MKFETIIGMSIVSKASNLNSIALLCECPLIKTRIFVRNCPANYDISLVGCKNEHIKIAHSMASVGKHEKHTRCWKKWLDPSTAPVSTWLLPSITKVRSD